MNLRRAKEGENADWMSFLSGKLVNIPLWDLAIPGSHDAMSYCLDRRSPVLKSESRFLQVLDRLVPCFTRPCVVRWATTQTWCISDQLNAGIRFFDLRVACKKGSKEALYFSHGVYTLQTVKEALSAVAVWLQQHSEEVVILVCSHFYELGEREHRHLVSFITGLFGHKLCPPQVTPTLRHCWGSGQQVIVSYDNEDVVKQHKQLWPMISYRYADSPDPKKVISYLEQQKAAGRPAEFFASGLNLTEDSSYVVHHPCETMRRMTMKAVSLLLGWVEVQRPGPQSTCLNIVCGDFVDLNEFPAVVIALNDKLLMENQR
ncbi:PI-PLC X domain-containing protein 1-like [Osmerus eperlanus]|uniref:PI-PLC X domain-containing protein 1-like n=1 Tax=Osmerus eperlanus TaxID=29151 RepID=UPI002E13B92D